MTGRKGLLQLIISVLISLGAGIVAALLTADNMEVYNMGYRPLLAPPGWVFMLVWTILYILMGVAAYLVYSTQTDDNSKKISALITYGLQLLVNIIWPIIFFGYRWYFLAFVWLLLLWYLVYLTIKKFSEINKLAATLLIPYIIWLTYAAYLNLAYVVYYY